MSIEGSVEILSFYLNSLISLHGTLTPQLKCSLAASIYEKLSLVPDTVLSSDLSWVSEPNQSSERLKLVVTARLVIDLGN